MPKASKTAGSEQLSSCGGSRLQVSSLQECMQDAIQVGVEMDADAIVIFLLSGDAINIALFAGRTVWGIVRIPS